jgi:hypothetical protein
VLCNSFDRAFVYMIWHIIKWNKNGTRILDVDRAEYGHLLKFVLVLLLVCFYVVHGIDVNCEGNLLELVFLQVYLDLVHGIQDSI